MDSKKLCNTLQKNFLLKKRFYIKDKRNVIFSSCLTQFVEFLVVINNNWFGDCG